jgi:hypothetical protein
MDSRRTLNGLALLIQERMKELPGSSPGRPMTRADLERRSGLPHSTVYAYARGDIRAERLTDEVRAKLKALADALELPVELLIAAARNDAPDYETQLLRLFRKLRTDAERERAILILSQFVAIGRRRRS